ncbi:MAG: hypothetical protein Q9218_004924 [Villophora microphyllina]
MKIIKYPAPKPFPFFELPGEIRSEIYGWVFHPSYLNRVLPHSRRYSERRPFIERRPRSCILDNIVDKGFQVLTLDDSIRSHPVVEKPAPAAINYFSLLRTSTRFYGEARAIAYKPIIFPVLRLPPQVRRRIYNYVFCTSIYNLPGYRFIEIEPWPYEIRAWWNLLLASKQIYQEAQAIAHDSYRRQLRKRRQTYNLTYDTFYEPFSWHGTPKLKLEPKNAWGPRIRSLQSLSTLQLPAIRIVISLRKSEGILNALRDLRSWFISFLTTVRRQGVLRSLEILLKSVGEMYWRPFFEALEPLTRLRSLCHVVFVAATEDMASAFRGFLTKRKQPANGRMDIICSEDADEAVRRLFNGH